MDKIEIRGVFYQRDQADHPQSADQPYSIDFFYSKFLLKN